MGVREFGGHRLLCLPPSRARISILNSDKVFCPAIVEKCGETVKTWPVVKKWVRRVELVSDDEMLDAMAWALHSLRLVLEPSGAASLALADTPDAHRVDASGVDTPDASGVDECVVCFAKPRDTIGLACMHLVLCAACAASLAECPICRVPTPFKRIFLS